MVNPEDLLIDSDAESLSGAFREFLGIREEVHVCPECDVGCEPDFVHDSARAAFDGGESPCWRCPSCGATFVREDGDSGVLGIDLYGRE